MDSFSIPFIVADESVDFSIIEYLREEDIDIYAIIESTPSISDTEVLSVAFEKDALLITEDKDFGELAIRLQKPNRGILLFRLFGLATEEKCKIIYETLKSSGNEMIDSFSVLTADKLRIRKIK
jgi:predicted nuclease of predicted toxin-antitoxin system